MTVSIEYILLGISILLFISVIASKISSKLGVPSLIVFVSLGMLIGKEGIGGIHFNNPQLAQSLGVIALVFILFAGGLQMSTEDFRSLIYPRRQIWKVVSLSTLGVFLTALLMGLFAKIVLDFSLLEGLLFGAVVSSTDAAAVFSVLRSKNINLKGQLKPLLELESGSNDPMAVFLTVGITNLLAGTTVAASLVSIFIRQMVLGAAIGYIMGEGMIFLINRLRLEYDGLYPVLTISLVLLTYGITSTFNGSGFLAVYIAGLVMSQNSFIHKKSLVHFHEGLAWLMQIMMFLTLGLMVSPSQLISITPMGLLLAIFLMAIARPASVLIALAPAKMELSQKLMISWVGLRGAVPIILATFPLLAGISRSDMIFNVVFFVVLTSALIQGSSIPLVAKLLGVEEQSEQRPKYPIEFEPTDGLQGEMLELTVPHNSAIVGKPIVEVGFPEGILIVLIRRGREFILPRGSTTIEAGDALLILARKEQIPRLNSIINSHPSC